MPLFLFRVGGMIKRGFPDSRKRSVSDDESESR